MNIQFDINTHVMIICNSLTLVTLRIRKCQSKSCQEEKVEEVDNKIHQVQPNTTGVPPLVETLNNQVMFE